MERETLEVKRQRLELSEELQRLGLSQMQSQACKETSLQTLKDIEIKIYFLEYELQLERENLDLKRQRLELSKKRQRLALSQKA